MGRRPKSTRTSTVDNPTGSEGDHLLESNNSGASPTERAAEQDELEILNRVRSESGNGGYVRLSRRLDDGTEYAQIAKIALADYSIDNVQRVYGGGHYRLRFCTENHKICGQRTVIIDPTIPFRNPAAGPVTPTPATPATTDLVALVKELTNRPQPPAGDGGLAAMMPLMMAMFQAQSQQIVALISKPAASDGTQTALLELLRLERERSKEKTPISELLESFNAFKKIQGNKTGDDDDGEEATIWDKIGKVAAPFGEALAEGLAHKFGGGDMGAGGGRPMLRAPAGSGEPAQQPTGEQPAGEKPATVIHMPEQRQPSPSMNPLVKMKIAQLQRAAIAAAQANADPAEFAQGILDDVPPKYYETLEGLAKADDWFSQMFGDHAEAVAQKEWLGKLRESLLAELKEVLGPAE